MHQKVQKRAEKYQKMAKKINDWRKTETNQNTLESYKGVNKKDDFQRALWAKFALFAYYFDLSLGRWAKSEEGLLNFCMFPVLYIIICRFRCAANICFCLFLKGRLPGTFVEFPNNSEHKRRSLDSRIVANFTNGCVHCAVHGPSSIIFISPTR